MFGSFQGTEDRFAHTFPRFYYTQFVGDPSNPPIIKGCDTFQGIALIDSDPYIEGK